MQIPILLLEKERTDVVNRGRDDKTIEVHFYITKSMDNILKKKILDNTYYDFCTLTRYLAYRCIKKVFAG